MNSIGRTRTLFRYTVFASVLAIASFIAGLPWGIVGVATAYALASLVIEPLYLVLTTRAVGVTVELRNHFSAREPRRAVLPHASIDRCRVVAEW